MAKKITEWDVQVGENTHHIEFKKNKISIDGAAPQKLKEFQITRVTGFQQVSIPVDTEVLTLYISTFGEYALVQNGIDLATGEPYDATPLPKWVWVFWILFIVDFAVVMGGALGAVFNFLGAGAVTKIVSKHEESKSKRAILATLTWFGITVAEAIIALLIAGAL